MTDSEVVCGGWGARKTYLVAGTVAVKRGAVDVSSGAITKVHRPAFSIILSVEEIEARSMVRRWQRITG